MTRDHAWEPYTMGNLSGLICGNCLHVAIRGARCRNCEEDVTAHTSGGQCCYAATRFVWYRRQCDG